MILPREAWTDVDPDRSRLEVMREPVEYLVVHHSAAPRDQSLEAIRRYHVHEHGWADIGYHYLIRHGVVHRGRPPWAAGAHAPPANRRSWGILVTGDYREADPETEDRRALLQLLAELLEQRPHARVVGHGEVQEGRTCPGRILDGIREQLPTRPGWVGYTTRPLL